jgi:glycopeptide antibiotics resistance protein
LQRAPAVGFAQTVGMFDAERAPVRHGRRLLVLFVVYLALLSWAIVWKLDVPYVGDAALLPRPIKLIPFVPSADAGGSSPLEVAANFLLFVPFGVYLGLLAPAWPRWQWTAAFLGMSLALESTQHLLSTGSFDTTDIIINAAGGLGGLGLLALSRRRLQARTAAVVTRICLIGTVASLIAIGIFVAAPAHYRPQRDVIVPTPAPLSGVIPERAASGRPKPPVAGGSGAGARPAGLLGTPSRAQVVLVSRRSARGRRPHRPERALCDREIR